MVTINNWAAYAVLYGQYKADPTTFNNNYLSVAGQNKQSALAALIITFGGSINIYRSSPGTTNFEPITLQTNSDGTKTPVQATCPD